MHDSDYTYYAKCLLDLIEVEGLENAMDSLMAADSLDLCSLCSR